MTARRLLTGLLVLLSVTFAGPAHAEPHTWRFHDGTAEVGFRYDDLDETLWVLFDLPASAVDSATSAELWIYARADGCGAGTGTLQFKRVNVKVTWTGQLLASSSARSDTVLAPPSPGSAYDR